uniref:C2H2-type domain-containing protein n=1 Tax=Anopheles farauti TaxID=69004 RepID=A0A182QTX1_9DIPT
MQKKIIQQQIPQVRKVYTTTTTQHQQSQQQSTMQLSSLKKINSLLQSGSVTVTGLSPGQQQRIVQKKPLSTVAITSTPTNNFTTTSSSTSTIRAHQKCCICGDLAGVNATLIIEASTTTTQTEFVTKLAKVIGSGYSMTIATDDLICRRCITILNQLDKLESDMEGLRSTLISYIHKNNNIPDEADTGSSSISSPPAKMPKLAHFSTTTAGTPSAKQQQQQPALTVSYQVLTDGNTSGGTTDLNASNSSDVEAQLTSMFEKNTSPSPGTVKQQQQIVLTSNNNGGVVSQLPSTQRKVAKLYKCMPCGFKTTDLALFQPHYENCPPRNAAAAAAAAAQNATAGVTSSGTVATPTNTAGITAGYRCKLCKLVFASIALLRQHSAQEHAQKTVVTTSGGMVVQQQQADQAQHVVTAAGGNTGVTANTNTSGTTTTTTTVLYSCNVCTYKTTDKQSYDDHLRKHIKLKPFKCRVCLMRFETREQASIHAKQHQPDYFKCGICNVTFSKREQLMSHLEVHEAAKKGTKQLQSAVAQQQQHQQEQQQHQQQQQQVQQQAPVTATPATATDSSSTQKLLQETIDEALRESIGDTIDAKLIQFHTCNACSLTFLNEKLYTQHIKTHATAAAPIFERMHSDPKGAEGAGGGANTATTAAATDGTHPDGTQANITFNITLPAQPEDGTFAHQQQQQQQQQEEHQQQSVGIDMPTLDQGDEQQSQKEQQQLQSMPVSMPSLDDDGEQSQNSQNSNTENVPMELEDMQGAEGTATAGAGQQINLILNDGQVLQLDNHILTTDAEGNQILVQGTDTEQIQQLLQSVGVVMQGGEGLGEGETLQMISGDGNNQMILVQGADGQEQLIDASLLNADGNIVIQQSQEGELNAEGTHITTEDGLQIPVSVAFTTAGGEAGHEGQLTVAVADGGEQQLQLHLQQAAAAAGEQVDVAGGEQHQGAILTESGQIILQAKDDVEQQQQQQQQQGGVVEDEEGMKMVVDGEENGTANESVTSETAADAGGQTNGGDGTTAASSNGTTTTTTTGGAISSGTTTNATNAAAANVTSSGSADDQMFNFDELIQPQIVVKQQQVK